MKPFKKTNRSWPILLTSIIFILACNLPSAGSEPTPDLFATLAASTPLTVDSTAQSSEPVSNGTEPVGHIAYTCQIFKVTAQNQICVINADGSGFQRLTTDNNKQHYYPSMSPDGQSVVYAAFREPNIYEIYEVDIASREVKQLTDRLGNVNGPEISPDGSRIVFKLSTPTTNELWLMDRDGSNPSRIPNASGWDAYPYYFRNRGCYRA